MEVSAFVNTKPKPCEQLLSFALLGSVMADQNKIVVTSQISTRLRRSRQQVSNPVSSIVHVETESFAEVQFVIDSCRFISQSNYLNSSNNDCDWLILACFMRD